MFLSSGDSLSHSQRHNEQHIQFVEYSKGLVNFQKKNIFETLQYFNDIDERNRILKPTSKILIEPKVIQVLKLCKLANKLYPYFFRHDVSKCYFDVMRFQRH